MSSSAVTKQNHSSAQHPYPLGPSQSAHNRRPSSQSSVSTYPVASQGAYQYSQDHSYNPNNTTTGAMSQPSSQQSFSMSQQSQNGGFGGGSFRPGSEGIYSAVYSGVDVYEMEVQGIAVMRRRNDSWLNATQILKVAGVEKGKRTKILEKEIQTGEHEKVQGGYGKYQGTWIQFERAVEVCRQYGVEEMLRPLLTYDMGQDGGVAGRGDFNTPTKEQAMAAQRKRMYNAGNEARTNGLSGTFFKNISSTASHAVAAISKARFESPGPRGRNGPTRPPSFSRQSSTQNADDFPGNSQQSHVSDYSHHQPNSQSQYSTQQTTQPMAETAEPPRKRQRVTMTPADSFNYQNSQAMELAQEFPGSPTEPNESFIYSNAGVTLPPHDGHSRLPPLPFEASHEADQKRSMLMSLFMENGTPDQPPEELLRKLQPSEIDMPIDQQCHTVLHWAATLARMPLLKSLIAAGANPFRTNAAGETAFMRACVVTNSMDHGAFPDLLEYLGPTIELRDNKGRTALHHIALTSAVKGRNAASRYYLESLLEWVVRKGSMPGNTNGNGSQSNLNGASNGAADGSQSQPAALKMGIGHFMREVVNVQDNSGDTALNIAARIGNRSIISQLLEVGANPNIPNAVGLKPVEFGIGKEENVDESMVNGGESSALADKNGSTMEGTQQARESSDDIFAAITNLIQEGPSLFQSELKTKQSSLDSLHATLRATSAQHAEARRTLESMQQTLRKQQVARQKVANLSHAREDEQVRLMQEQKRHQSQGGSNSISGAWETELGASVEAANEAEAEGNGAAAAGLLPSAAVLRARLTAVTARRDVTRKMAGALKGRSRDVEVKYRRVVAMCTGVPEGDVDAVVDGLLRAVESEKGELEVARVSRFLGGVEGVVS